MTHDPRSPPGSVRRPAPVAGRVPIASSPARRAVHLRHCRQQRPTDRRPCHQCGAVGAASTDAARRRALPTSGGRVGTSSNAQTGNGGPELVNHALGAACRQREAMLDAAGMTDSLDYQRPTGSRRQQPKDLAICAGSTSRGQRSRYHTSVTDLTRGPPGQSCSCCAIVAVWTV